MSATDTGSNPLGTRPSRRAPQEGDPQDLHRLEAPTARFPYQEVRDKLQVKAAKILPIVGLARSKEGPVDRGHDAQ